MMNSMTVPYSFIDRGNLVSHHRYAYLLLLTLWVLIFQVPLWDWVISDDSIYTVIGHEFLRGHWPYVAIWDNKPIGIYSVFAVGEWMFDGNPAGIRAIYTLTIIATSFVLYRIGFIASGRRSVGVLASMIYPAYSGTNDNSETFILWFLSLGVYWLFVAGRPSMASRRSILLVACSGLAFGCALQFKYTSILEVSFIFGAAAAFWLLDREREFPAIALSVFAAGVAVAIPTAFVMSLYAMAGHLRELLFANFVAPSRYVTQGEFSLTFADVLKSRWCFFPLLIGGASVIIASIWRRAPRAFGKNGSKFFILTAWAFGGAISVNLSGRYYQHYFLLFVPALALIVAWWVCERPAGRSFALLSRIAVLVLLIAIPSVPYVQDLHTIWSSLPPPADYDKIAAEIRSGLKPGDTIFVADDNPILYVLTGANIPTKYAWPWHILLDQYGLQLDADREVQSIFSQKPRFVVAVEPVHSYHAAETTRRRLLVESYIAAQYEPVATQGHLVIFARR